jgi:hypothetical protein
VSWWSWPRSDGTVLTHEISTGGSNTAECSAATVRAEPGRRKTDPRRVGGSPRSGAGRGILRQARVCSHCRSHRPLKDVRTRRLSSLSGTVEIRAPRFLPCRCAVTHPVAEIMPDRCTPEYECVIARMGSLLPYRRARTLLSEFLPLGDVPAVETTRRQTMRVALAWSSKRWRANLPHRRLRRILFPSPSTAAMCGRSEVTRFVRLG